MKRVVVAGASRGIGAAIAGRLVDRGWDVISLSRGQAPHGRWVEADLSDPASAALVAREVGDAPLDALIYGGGVWEKGAFTSEYDFAATSVDETLNVISVNMTAPILLSQSLRPALSKAAPGRILFIGSLSGLDNAASPEVANSASKYGLRGAAQALEKSLRDDGIGVTVLNPDNVATPEVLEDIQTGAFGPQVPIPMEDLLACVECALSLSPASTLREMNLAQIRPGPG